MQRAALACALAVFTVASSTLADEPLPFPGISPGNEPVVEPGHWTLDPGRPFIALRADLGYLYFKPRFSFGYGKPFTLWGGLDVVPFVTPDTAGGYGGLRLQLDWFEIRAGARFVHAFSRQYLTPQPTYSIVDLAENTGHPSDYLALEVEASAAIPAGPGDILALATVSSIQFVPAGYNVFDETLHVVVSPPAVYRQRLGYSLILGRERIARLGLVGEVIEMSPTATLQVVLGPGLIALLRHRRSPAAHRDRAGPRLWAPIRSACSERITRSSGFDTAGQRATPTSRRTLPARCPSANRAPRRKWRTVKLPDCAARGNRKADASVCRLHCCQSCSSCARSTEPSAPRRRSCRRGSSSRSQRCGFSSRSASRRSSCTWGRARLPMCASRVWGRWP